MGHVLTFRKKGRQAFKRQSFELCEKNVKTSETQDFLGRRKMNLFINFLVGLIAVLHIGFLYLEMFLWNTPKGHKIFKLDPTFAEQSAALASNQGLYNGFLAAGLIWSLMTPNTAFGFQLKLFFAACVFVAGLYGWMTVSKTILFAQALPAGALLLLLLLSTKM